MTRRLKVYRAVTHLGGNASGLGQVEAVVAALNQRAASEAMHEPPSFIGRWGSDTGNPVDVEAAMSDPGTVFFVPLDTNPRSAAEYIRWMPDQGEHHP